MAEIEASVGKAIQAITARFQSTPTQVAVASERAAKKVLKWVSVRVSRDLAKQLSVAQKVLRPRITVKVRGRDADRIVVLWVGTAGMPLEKSGRVKQGRKGVSAGSNFVNSAFFNAVYDSEKKVFIRASKAASFPANVERLRAGRKRTSTSFTDNGRFPVIRVGLDVDTHAQEILKRWSAQIDGRFRTVFEHELQYVLNNAK